MCNNMISILTNISNILKDVHIVPNLKNNDLTFCKFIQILNTLVPSKLLKSHIFKMFTMAKQKKFLPSERNTNALYCKYFNKINCNNFMKLIISEVLVYYRHKKNHDRMRK